MHGAGCAVSRRDASGKRESLHQDQRTADAHGGGFAPRGVAKQGVPDPEHVVESIDVLRKQHRHPPKRKEVWVDALCPQVLAHRGISQRQLLHKPAPDTCQPCVQLHLGGSISENRWKRPENSTYICRARPHIDLASTAARRHCQSPAWSSTIYQRVYARCIYLRIPCPAADKLHAMA